jgi:hypothetical protein
VNLGCKLDGLIYKINTNKVIQKTEFLRIYCVACRVLKYLNVLTLSLTATLHLNIFYLLSFIFYLLSFIYKPYVNTFLSFLKKNKGCYWRLLKRLPLNLNGLLLNP